MYITDKVEGIVDLNNADSNPLGVITVVEVFKALYKGLGKLVHLTNVSLNHLLLSSE